MKRFLAGRSEVRSSFSNLIKVIRIEFIIDVIFNYSCVFGTHHNNHAFVFCFIFIFYHYSSLILTLASEYTNKYSKKPVNT